MEDEEPLADAELDDFFNPNELHIFLSDGVSKAREGRFDVEWSTQGDYNIHYTDDLGNDLRWDVHPHDYTDPDDDPHFHPPPDASNDDDDVEDSCITVSTVELVARATVRLWRDVYPDGSLADSNDLIDPP
ncbi:hypothetical protein [Natrinema amylolyticum]|uniref:hypothetical protein n=1 Tax=Natrinema amylolyticum TaxID=2878679 RepID=UPI001CFC33D4|nr:hypothetical protein [Natrinema amylolyticum]